jgi:hypothetical protein
MQKSIFLRVSLRVVFKKCLSRLTYGSVESFLRIKRSRKFWTGESSAHSEDACTFSLYFFSAFFSRLSLLLNSTLFSSFLIVLPMRFLPDYNYPKVVVTVCRDCRGWIRRQPAS